MPIFGKAMVHRLPLIVVSLLAFSALQFLLGSAGTIHAAEISNFTPPHLQSTTAYTPNASGGGGCHESVPAYIGSCITINSSGYIVPNAYTSVTGSQVEIVLTRNGSVYSSYAWHGPVPAGHYIYPSSLQVPKSNPGTWVAISFIDIGNTTYEVNSPAQYT